MPSQQIPAAPVVGGVTSRRHAKLLHHLFEGNGGAPAKDLRIRRVVPPASTVCAAAASKPVPAVQIQVQVQSTPPEPSAAAAAEDRERKPILPRSKLVRDPASFGYRRLLPFLNQMAAKNGSAISDGKDTPSETKLSVSANKELPRSSDPVEPRLADEPAEGSQGGAAPADPMEPLAAEPAGKPEMKDCPDSFREGAKILFSADPAASKPACVVTRCARSRFVHHAISFSYKRLLPFLMENDISSQGEDRAKIRRVSEEEHITSGENHVSKGSPEEPNGAEGERIVVEETTSVSGGDSVGHGGQQLQSAVAEVSLDGSSTAKVREVPVSSEKGQSASDVAGGQCQTAAVSDDCPEEKNVAHLETAVEKREEASQPEEKSVPVDSVEQPVAKAAGDQEMTDSRDTVTEQTKPVPGDLAISRPCPTRCPRSRLVHQRNSFSYKRMLPFLMANQISSQEGDRAKFQRVPEEKQLALQESPVMASVPEISTDSAEASYKTEVGKIVEEIAPCLLKGGNLQPAVAEVSPDGSIAEVHKVSPEVVSSLDKDELASDVDGVQCQLPVSEDIPKESNATEADEIVVEENTEKSDESSVDLQSAASEVCPQEVDAAQKPVLASDGDEATELASDKDAFLVKDQHQRCDSKLLQDKAELVEVQQCQSSESGCSDVGLGSPTNTATVDNGADQDGAQETHDSVASPDALLLDVGTMICKPSDTCLKKQCPSPRKLSPVSCLKKRFLSPKKGILKTNGCKGICMCLDCSVFRLRADRAFEFSRKQMREADDIIGNLLKEVTSLWSLAEKSSGQQEQIEKACERASRVEEVARERRRQMQLELNAHCKIPGPRVKFAQYAEEKMAASSPRGGDNNIRRQPSL